jgi:Alw26I/Eco31I/Esp3I family type II restriction m6 adenine DNA methyltransferase
MSTAPPNIWAMLTMRKGVKIHFAAMLEQLRKTCYLIIMKHLQVISQDSHSLPSGFKSLFQKSTGKFYTPIWMANQLADKLARAMCQTSGIVRAVDPFCGDGRLMVALANRIAEDKQLRNHSWEFELWDRNQDSLYEAKPFLTEAVKSAKINATVRIRQWDSFLDSSRQYGNFDVIITNPPWETLKPDQRDLGALSIKEKKLFLEGLRDYDQYLAVKFPISQPSTKLYGWGTNLSRCGLELIIKLLKQSGHCGVVLPSSILADQVSASLRRWLFLETSIQAIDYYPAEAKPFDNVDQACILTIIQRNHSPSRIHPVITQHDRARRKISSGKIRLTAEDLEKLEYRIPVELCQKELELLLKLSQFRPLSDWAITRGGALWMGRELDETNYRSFVSNIGEVGFIKGRNITRFSSLEAPTHFIREGMKKIPPSTHFRRVAWRDVSRRSQARRMLATIIPAGVVTGNSLHVAYFLDDNHLRLQALLGVLNSLTFEFQLRSRLGTGHVSLGTVRELRVPNLDDAKFVRKVSQLVGRALTGDSSAEAAIEIAVADAYCLSEEERAILINHFAS